MSPNEFPFKLSNLALFCPCISCSSEFTQYPRLHKAITSLHVQDLEERITYDFGLHSHLTDDYIMVLTVKDIRSSPAQSAKKPIGANAAEEKGINDEYSL